MNGQEPRQGAVLIHLATFILVVLALYFGKPVLMPLALATLLAFLLSPVVNGLTRAGIRHAFAVLIVVILMFSVLGGMIWGFGSQLTALAYQLPDYKLNVREKVLDLRNAGKGSALERVRNSWRELKGEIEKDAVTNDIEQAVTANPEQESEEPEPKPVPVVVHGQGESSIPTALGPLVEVAATAGLVVVLVIFMLLRKRELRDRLVVFFGQNSLPATTKALDEAAERISRYLLMQTIINSSYGLAVGIALYFVGLPYALMWGFLAALLRFIPYVGPWLGATMPILLSLAVFPGWIHPFIVLGLILMLELVSNMIMEPLLYGQTVGVSEVALILAVAFWTWIWGPIGLALATPLTVCIVVLGKYVPGMAFLPLLMGDESVMDAHTRFYQRLLALDHVEAGQIARTYSRGREMLAVYDELFLPALTKGKRDYLDRKLTSEDFDSFLDGLEKLVARTVQPPAPAAGLGGETTTVFGIPVQDRSDELALAMLSNLLPRSISLESISAEALTGEALDLLERSGSSIVCLSAVSPGGGSAARYLAKKILARNPAVSLVAARWGLPPEKKKAPSGMPTAALGTTLSEARNYIIHFVAKKPGVPAMAASGPENRMVPPVAITRGN